MSDVSHAVSEKLKCYPEMCLDSFGVANHSRGHHDCTDSAVKEVIYKTDIYIQLHHWFRATGHFSTLKLATGHFEALELDPVEHSSMHFTKET